MDPPWISQSLLITPHRECSFRQSLGGVLDRERGGIVVPQNPDGCFGGHTTQQVEHGVGSHGGPVCDRDFGNYVLLWAQLVQDGNEQSFSVLEWQGMLATQGCHTLEPVRLLTLLVLFGRRLELLRLPMSKNPPLIFIPRL